jgi:hypothetical protein
MESAMSAQEHDVAGTGAIFIHAMWRTGSTYFWKKFRDQESYCAYYEPLNEALLTLTENDRKAPRRKRMWKFKPTTFEQHYFCEYPLKPEGGVPGLTPELCYKRYCLDENSTDPELENYIRYLISEAESRRRRPVLKFNRSLLRSAWIRRRFFGFHLLLLRDPREVWISFQRQVPYFSGVVCQIVGQNRDHRLISPIAERWRIPLWDSGHIGRNNDFYSEFAVALGDKMYSVFHAFYMLTVLYNVMHVDLIVDMDMVSEREIVCRNVENELRKHGVFLSLSDCKVPGNRALCSDDFTDIERDNLERLYGYLSREITIPRNVLTNRAPALSDKFRSTIEPYVV